MILDKLENGHKYDSLNPLFKVAFDFLLSNDLLALEAGKVELQGKDLVVNVNNFKGKAEEDCRMESHNNFIDIQLPVNSDEFMGWKARTELKKVTTPYNPDKDVEFYADPASTLFVVPAGHFAIFFPEDGHQPGIAPGKEYRKLIVKVRV